MPYTPPSHRSPASSASASPDVSRRSSLQSGSRPSLPRSASYLNKHRRTPSVTTVDGSAGSLTPQGTSEDLPSLAAGTHQHGSGSIHQSPAPWSDDRGMPKGAVISPPDSASSGSDDEMTPEIRGRKSDKLKDLRDAVGQIPHARTASPQPLKISTDNTSPAAQDDDAPPATMHFSFSTSALSDFHNPSRKASHVRSATEPNAPVVQSAENSVTGSEEETDEDLKTKPQMVRKKSGELVRPALRPSSHRRPSSMPGTPVYSKAVHFDSHLEHVRHFLQVDRPLAVSAGSSPVDNYESDNEYPFPNENRSANRTPPFEWEILTPNFPHDGPARWTLPVKLEKVWLSADQKSMLGSICVANIAFQKHVTCRFTLDYWKTTSEVTAEYAQEIRRESNVGYDRFDFSIKLSDTANLESKTLYLCVRYSVNGQDFWDNNSNANFQIDFRKKHLPQNGKKNFQGTAGRPRTGTLPRSSRRPNGSSKLRPKSMPASLEEFGNSPQFKFDQPIHEYLGEPGPPGLRLKTKSSSDIASDNIVKGLSSPSGVAFANRYDFGASLSAAVQAAKDSMGKDRDALYMKDNARGLRFMPEPVQNDSPPQLFSPVPAPSGTDAPIPSLPSSSYEELVNKYCFFGTKPSAPSQGDQMKSGRFDGPSGEVSQSSDRAKATVSWQLSPSASQSSSESTSPNYITTSGPSKDAAAPTDTSSNLAAVHAPERFAWRGDTHTTPAIRG